MDFKGYKKNVSWTISSLNDYGGRIPRVFITAKNIVEAAEKFQEQKPGATIIGIEKLSEKLHIKRGRIKCQS